MYECGSVPPARHATLRAAEEVHDVAAPQDGAVSSVHRAERGRSFMQVMSPQIARPWWADGVGVRPAKWSVNGDIAVRALLVSRDPPRATMQVVKRCTNQNTGPSRCGRLSLALDVLERRPEEDFKVPLYDQEAWTRRRPRVSDLALAVVAAYHGPLVPETGRLRSPRTRVGQTRRRSPALPRPGRPCPK